MSRFILLPATGKPSDAPVFATALAAARLLGGHLAFLHVRPDVQHEVASFAAADFGMGSRDRERHGDPGAGGRRQPSRRRRRPGTISAAAKG